MTRLGKRILQIGIVWMLLMFLVLWMDHRSEAVQTSGKSHFRTFLIKATEEGIIYHFVPYLEYRKTCMDIAEGKRETQQMLQESEMTILTWENVRQKEGMQETIDLRMPEHTQTTGVEEEVPLFRKENDEKEDIPVPTTETPQVITDPPHTQKKEEIVWQEYGDFSKFLNAFYIVDADTEAGADLLDYRKMLEKDLKIDKNTSGPQILIYHTHSQEGFVDSIPGDDTTTIMAVGERLKVILEEDYGYQVYHHQGKYDVTTRDNAYSRSLDDICEILQEYPSIQVILDLHRDDMDPDTHLVTTIDGKKTARFMFFNGISRTKKNGDISYLYNPNLEDNLAFSFQAKVLSNEYYPGLTRKNYLRAYRYNLHLLPRSMLIEIGAQNNTLEEALNACDPLADILDMVLSGE